MKLIKCLFIASIFLSFFVKELQAQVSYSNVIDERSDVYDKITGKKLDLKMLQELIRNNKNIAFEKEINERGEVSAFIYNPSNNGRLTRDVSLRTKPKETFPSFIVTTTDGEVLKLKELQGNTVVVYFNLFLKAPFTDPKTLLEFGNLINSVQMNKVVPLIFTQSSEGDVEKFKSHTKVPYPIVPDAHNFMIKYLVNKFPSFVVINPDGTLNTYVDDLTQLKKVLENL